MGLIIVVLISLAVLPPSTAIKCHVGQITERGGPVLDDVPTEASGFQCQAIALLFGFRATWKVYSTNNKFPATNEGM